MTKREKKKIESKIKEKQAFLDSSAPILVIDCLKALGFIAALQWVEDEVIKED